MRTIVLSNHFKIVIVVWEHGLFGDDRHARRCDSRLAQHFHRRSCLHVAQSGSAHGLIFVRCINAVKQTCEYANGDPHERGEHRQLRG